MANIRIKSIGINQFGGVETCGNITRYRSTLKTNPAGGAINANVITPLAVNDVVTLNVMPAGMVLHDETIIVSTPFSAGVTASLGFMYVDGIDRTDVPQDPAYFGNGIVLGAIARLRTVAANALVRLPKEAYLVLTITGAGNTQVGVMDVIVDGERLGN